MLQCKDINVRAKPYLLTQPKYIHQINTRINYLALDLQTLLLRKLIENRFIKFILYKQDLI